MCALTHHTHTFTWNLEAHGALATAAEGLELALSQHTLIHRNMCALTHTHAYLKTRGTWSACYRSRGAWARPFTHMHIHTHIHTHALKHRNMCVLTLTLTWKLEAHGALATAAEGLELALSHTCTHIHIHTHTCTHMHTQTQKHECSQPHTHLKIRGAWSASYRSRGAWARPLLCLRLHLLLLALGFKRATQQHSTQHEHAGTIWVEEKKKK